MKITLSEAQILIGPTAGLQYSWVSFDNKDYKDTYKVKPVFGYNVGGALSFRVRKRFFLTSSFLYSTKGKVVEGKADKLLRHEITYRYIDIPIIYSVDFKAKISSNDQFKYFFGIGPNISYWLGGKGTLYNSDYAENNVPPMSYKIVFNRDENNPGSNQMVVQKANRVQLGLNLAAGVVAEPMPNQKFVVVTRFEFGHSFFSTEHNGVFTGTYYQDELRSRNIGVRLSVVYMVDTKTEDRKKGKSTSTLKKVKRKR
jgi:hypothetical protein